LRQRLERLGSVAKLSLTSVEEQGAVADALEQLLRSKPTVILIASTTAPAAPYDIVGRAMLRVGCQTERFLAPVEPGTLILLSYKEDVPILSAPGCFRSAKANVLDLVLPRLLARYRLSSWDFASLGRLTLNQALASIFATRSGLFRVESRSLAGGELHAACNGPLAGWRDSRPSIHRFPPN
jgi:molybdopterin biosynthesis enzyme